MKKISYILLAALLAVVSCNRLELEQDVAPAEVPEGKVEVTFRISVPCENIDTKADAGFDDVPHLVRLHAAVFGGSGYFNEWVQATKFTPATQNYDPYNTAGENGTNATEYDVTFLFSVSNSRLKVHIIGNCPEEFINKAPISANSNENTEEFIMSKYMRSHIGETNNDGYWQKIVLPDGIAADFDLETGQYAQHTITVGGQTETVYSPNAKTLAQFPKPIILCRNFARIYLVNEAPDVQIISYDLAYAPQEGPFAPLLAAPYTADKYGQYMAIEDNDNKTDFWNESFFINIQDYPVIVPDDAPSGTISCEAAPYNYKGFSPSDIPLGTFPDSFNNFTGKWDEESSIQKPLYVYERTIKRSNFQATRVLIYAKKGDEDAKYYSLDILNAQKQEVALIRNNTYTVVLKGIAPGTGETSPKDAAETNSSNVAQSATQEIQEISDGTTSIGTSYTEKVFVSPATPYTDPEGAVYFRYISNTQQKTLALDKVTLKFGNKEDLEWTEYADGIHSALKSVEIEKDGSGNPIEYVRKNNAWVVAGTGDENLEHWGRIKFSTYTNVEQDNLVLNDYYTKSLNETIRVTGESGIFRDVTIKLMPLQTLKVKCLQPYVAQAVGEKEVVRVYIPVNLTRSVFPLDFKVEPATGTLTPDNDVLPVTNGTSISFDTSTGELSTNPSYLFVKTVTHEDYQDWIAGDESHLETIDGKTWAFFDCHFKTNSKNSATTVFVKNEYFSYGQGTNCYDSFKNYVQRKFDHLNLPQRGAGQNVDFTFRMDFDGHGGRTGNNVIWQNNQTFDNVLSDNYRVLPTIINVRLEGCSPRKNGDNYVDNNISWDDERDCYLLYTRNNNNQTAWAFLNSRADTEQTLHLVVDNDVDNHSYSVTLSTEVLYDEENFPIPNFYEPVTKIAKSYTFTGGFATEAIAYGNVADDFTFSYNAECIEPVTMTFTNCSPTGDPRFKKIGNQEYLYTPTDNTTSQTFSVTTRVDGKPSITLVSGNYASKTFTTGKYGAQTLTATITIGSGNYDYSSISNNNVTFAFNNNCSGGRERQQWSLRYNYWKNIGNGKNKDGVITITPPVGSVLKTCTITYYNGYDDNNVTYSPTNGQTTSSSNTDWTGSANPLVITMVGANNNNNRVSSIEVTYESYYLM